MTFEKDDTIFIIIIMFFMGWTTYNTSTSLSKVNKQMLEEYKIIMTELNEQSVTQDSILNRIESVHSLYWKMEFVYKLMF